MSTPSIAKSRKLKTAASKKRNVTSSATARRKVTSAAATAKVPPKSDEPKVERVTKQERLLTDTVEKLDFLPRSQFLRQQAGFKKKALRVSAERLTFRCAAAVANWRWQRVALSALHDQTPIF